MLIEQLGDAPLIVLWHQTPQRHPQAGRHHQHAHRLATEQTRQTLHIQAATVAQRHLQHLHVATLQNLQQTPAAR